MMQTAVFGFLYEELCTRITAALSDCESGVVQFSVLVSDLSQLAQDKNGQRIIIDEKRYELPSLFAVMFRVELSADTWKNALEGAGCVAGYMKDHAIVELGDLDWHGNQSGRTFFEPVIRDVRSCGGEGNMQPVVILEYRIEAGINSAIGEEFKRVEKRDVRTEKME